MSVRRKEYGSRRKYFILGVYCLISFPIFSQHIYLELNLNNQAIQRRVLPAQPRPALEVFRVIERASQDKRIRGIILNISAFDTSRENLWELRTALEQFKSQGKKICAFISAADLDLYCLATVADKIVMDEQGTLSLMGYAWGRGYAQHALEKLGIGARELRYLEYKSAAETFTRDAISEADRRQYGEWLEDVFTLTRDTLMKARSWSGEEFDAILNREFLYSARSALERKLVDRTGRKSAVEEAIKEIEGAEVKHFVLYGDSDSSLTDSKAFYGPGTAGGLFSKPPVIAVIYANGQTDMERGMAARSLARTIQEVSERKRVRAIVIRINSPGGSAEAADYIAEAVKSAKERISVVVSMGSVAASGGYWAGMYASHITASPYTLTGSIGVIGSWFYDKGLNNKLGLTVDTLQRGEHADLMTGIVLPRRDLNPVEEVRYRGYILDMYGDFVAKVASGRNMDIGRVEAAAQGRVFSGIGALNAGLIDSIGGFSDAIRIARDLAGIPENKKVLYSEYPKPRFIDRLLNRLPILSAILSPTSSMPASGSSGETLSAAAFLADLFLPMPLLADLRYRLERNGQVMPILPLESNWLPE
ncbi:signal peptide peptidase SppA [Spirochaetia bacterium]|nr:signal peptide peptidase SppA [Spirochaetia bacterium]